MKSDGTVDRFGGVCESRMLAMRGLLFSRGFDTWLIRRLLFCGEAVDRFGGACEIRHGEWWVLEG